MKAKFLQSLLKQFPSRKKRRSKAGFTLIELLISMMIGAIIITILLSFVIDLLDRERREYASTETQREMQLALDFIANDLREAVYVYDRIDLTRPASGQNIPPLRNFIPVPDGFVPVLAFWKSERLPYDESAETINCSPSPACEAIQIRRRAYSLVVYMQATRDQGNPQQKWKGNSRIVRYVLRKHKNISDPAQWNPGFVDPVEKNPPSNNKSSFALWPYGGSPIGSLQSGTPPQPGGGIPVLIDFVDSPTRSIANLPGCINTTDQNSPVYSSDPNAPQYRRVPNDPTISTSFYACVKTPPAGAAAAANQDVIIYLRGNPEGKIAAKEPLVTIQTQAVARGVINKEPQ